MATATLPGGPQDLTAEWLTAALRQTGTISNGTEVASFGTASIGEGEGLLGQLARVNLTYHGADGTEPTRLIAKFPSPVEENRDLAISLSVLAPPQPMTVATEDDLLTQLRPGVDGLILRHGAARAVFLPVVWHSFPEPRDFFRQLKTKAGLAPAPAQARQPRTRGPVPTCQHGQPSTKSVGVR